MLKWSLTVAAIVLAVPGLLMAQPGEKETGSDRWKLIGIMHSFAQEFATLRPYLVSKEKFAESRALTEIRTSLAKIESTMASGRPAFVESNPALNLTFSMMSYHVKETKRAFERGAVEYARKNLNATTNFCISCHTQVPIPKSKLGGFWTENEGEKVTLEGAEFLFITRRFDMAMNAYDRLARTFPKSKLTPDQLNEVYNRKIAFFARVLRDPNVAIENLEQDLKNTAIPADTRANLTKWISYFKAWKSEKVTPEKMEPTELIAFVRKSLPEKGRRAIAPADPDLVEYLRNSGLLLERLMKHPQGSHTQEMLYQLALFEKALGKMYPYSLYQPYLRECVLKFPKAKYTKACFELYEEEVRETYSGLKPIPDVIRSTLDSMKRNL